MLTDLKAFLQFLRLNRNASAHTVRAYQSDLSQFLSHTAAVAGVKRADLQPPQLDRAAIRNFMADLHKREQSRATAARIPSGRPCGGHGQLYPGLGALAGCPWVHRALLLLAVHDRST